MDDYSIKIYFKEINKYDLLTREQEKTCSKEQLINSNLRLVVKIAKEFQNSEMSLSDLINEGNIGLIKAVEKFDPKKGYRFSSYGSYWIKQGIRRAINEKKGAIRMPNNRREELKKVDKKKYDILNLPDKEQVKKIAQETYFSEKKVEYLLFLLNQKVVTLENSEEEENGLYHTTKSNEETPERKCLESSLKEEINKISKILTKREWEIIQLRYGLNNKKSHTLEETGKIYGLTRERIRQIQGKAIRKLKHKSEKLKDYRELQNY